MTFQSFSSTMTAMLTTTINITMFMRNRIIETAVMIEMIIRNIFDMRARERVLKLIYKVCDIL